MNEFGVYKVIVFVCGRPRYMMIDDYFPVTKDDKPLFAGAHYQSRNAWPMLLEKVWAKINVNYEKTCAGWAHEVTRVLTGAGAKDFICSQLSITKMWDILLKGY